MCTNINVSSRKNRDCYTLIKTYVVKSSGMSTYIYETLVVIRLRDCKSKVVVSYGRKGWSRARTKGSNSMPVGDRPSQS